MYRAARPHFEHFCVIQRVCQGYMDTTAFSKGPGMIVARRVINCATNREFHNTSTPRSCDAPARVVLATREHERTCAYPDIEPL